MFFHLFSEKFQNVLGPCVSDTALILVNPVYKESRFSSEQTRIKLVPNSSVILNNLFKMSSPTFCDVVAVRLLHVYINTRAYLRGGGVSGGSKFFRFFFEK